MGILSNVVGHLEACWKTISLNITNGYDQVGEFFSLLLKFNSVNSLKFSELNRKHYFLIEHGYHKHYPDNRIEGFFANRDEGVDTLALIVFVLVFKDHGDGVLLVIAALNVTFRLEILKFIEKHFFANSVIEATINDYGKSEPPTGDPPKLGRKTNEVILSSLPAKVKAYPDARKFESSERKSLIPSPAVSAIPPKLPPTLSPECNDPLPSSKSSAYSDKPSQSQDTSNDENSNASRKYIKFNIGALPVQPAQPVPMQTQPQGGEYHSIYSRPHVEELQQEESYGRGGQHQGAVDYYQ
ncbi:hypothetical protein BDZ45DRAFT_732960 [Acephala macrosclerotiorum]|nr:hypothetical protein BDZ45DRAFT_732960 [Acephala macrosclerotiorum]